MNDKMIGKMASNTEFGKEVERCRNIDATFIVIINARVVYGPVTLKKATAYLNDRMWAMETTDHAFIAKVIGNGT